MIGSGGGGASPSPSSSSSSSSVTIDKSKFGDDLTVGNFIDRLGKAKNYNQLVSCAVNFLSIVALSNNSNNCVTSQYNMLIKVAKPRKLIKGR